ncbi:MAG TPA: DUF3426 domain-containing protein [Syntrophales bacterium]|nr:DUF3426 domain-containing protein [Syntrophales bacterium]
MIIQCQRCLTKFRFDDALMAGEGVWVRCSRCRQVFFEENPAAAGTAGTEPPRFYPPEPEAPHPDDADLSSAVLLRAEPSRAAAPGLSETVLIRPDAPLSSAGTDLTETVLIRPPVPETPARRSAEPDLSETVLIRPEASGFPQDGGSEETDIGIEARPDDLVLIDAENGPPIEKDVDAPHTAVPDDGGAPDEPDATEPGGEPEDEDTPAAPPRRKRRGWLWALVLILILALGAGALFLLYPEAGRQTLDSALKALRPVTGLLPGAATKDQSMDLKTLAIQDVRQRIVNNWLVGDLRIVEGSVVNRAPHAATEIQVRVRHYDATGAVLAEQTAFCGNFLTEEELGTLPEAEIQLELAHPRGSDVSNEKIEPGGQIPFMVVFVRPPAKVARTTVAIAGADRLLP